MHPQVRVHPLLETVIDLNPERESLERVDESYRKAVDQHPETIGRDPERKKPNLVDGLLGLVGKDQGPRAAGLNQEAVGLELETAVLDPEVVNPGVVIQLRKAVNRTARLGRGRYLQISERVEE